MKVARIMSNVRLILACPFLLAGIGLVLLGRILLDREDRKGFDGQYFGPVKPNAE